MHDPDAGWTRRLSQRFVTLWYLKALGTAGFMVLFFQAYFWVLRNPSTTPLTVPLLAPDHWVPLTPEALYAYGWLWVFVSLPPALLGDLRSLLRYGAWVAAMCISCLLIFWWWPTQTPAFDIDWSAHPELAFLKGIDAAGNACPSLHVAAALHAAGWLLRELRLLGAPAWVHGLTGLQAGAIVWSTMAIRQHVAIDVICGAAVGLLFLWLSMPRSRSAAVSPPVRA